MDYHVHKQLGLLKLFLQVSNMANIDLWVFLVFVAILTGIDTKVFGDRVYME